ncbi:hypothetical protein [Geminocystis herdmanii]|uniref:hypothetical protein n=1 Tax=Geminocystis herdmanii TaxID=669359 RepID=UPI0003486BFB|nr:hypothetical protein [Geminocystis herdmanii]
MDIFVKTSNKSKDYKWFNAENSQIQFPSISNPNQLEKLVDTEFESLVLYRESRQLILAITALKSGRTDNRTRPIRNSLIWIADNDDEAKIRAIIYEYLTAKDELESKVAKAITETPEIKIDYQKIKSVGDETKVKRASLPQSNLAYKIGNLAQYKQDLSKEIEQYNLPKNEGLLILITDSKSKEIVEELKPWRGLSSKIYGGEWIILEKKSQSSTSSKSSKNYSTNNNSNGLFINGLSIVLAIVLIVSNIFWFYQINELKQKINQIENLQSVIDKSKADVERLTTNLETDINTAKDKFEKAFIEAKKQFNKDISGATTKYKTEMTKVKQNLSDSVQKLN